MAAEVMEVMCPRGRFGGVARLDGYRLAFTRRSIKTGTGVADVIHASNETVWGVLYEIEDEELPAIDRKEGYGWAYTRVTCPVQLEARAKARWQWSTQSMSKSQRRFCHPASTSTV
jgi:gamma-glutamylcyclotransferase (GGCT)/AIG2-like uncharacterized protein YtfP